MERLKLAVIQFLLALVLIIYLIGKDKLPVILFWIIYFLLIFTSYQIILKSSNKYKIAALFILVLSMAFIYSIPHFGIHYLTSDDVFEAQFAQTIVETGKFNPEAGSGFSEEYYGYNPTLHFIMALASYITGLSCYRLVIFFLILFKITYVALFYLIASKLLHRKKDVFIATFIFISTAGFSFLSVTRRVMAGVFVLLLFFLLIRSKKPNYIFHYTMFSLVSVLLVMSNYSVSLYFIAFLAGALAFTYILRFFPGKKEFPKIWPRLIIIAAIFIFWELMFLDIYTGIYGEYLNQIFEFAGNFSSGTPDIYRWYETFAIYFSQLVFLVVSFSGLTYLFYSKLKNYEWGKNDFFLLYASIFGLFFYIITALILPTRWDVAIAFIFWFFQLPLAILAGHMIGKTNMKRYGIYFSSAIIIILFAGAMLTGLHNPRYTNRMPDEDIVLGDDIRGKTPGLLYAAQWVKSHNINYIIADRDTFEALSGLAGANVNMYSDNVEALYTNNEIFARPYFEFGQYPHTRKLMKAEYFAINKAFAKHPNNVGNFRLDLSRFDNNSDLDKVYSNEQIIIYRLK